MYSILSDIKNTITAHMADFTIPLGAVVGSYDVDTGRDYPIVVVQEVSNLPQAIVSTKGESRTTVAYQLDILTRDALDKDDVPINRGDAALLIARELAELLDEHFKLTRISTAELPSTPDAVRYIMRVQGVIDEYGFTYRPSVF